MIPKYDVLEWMSQDLQTQVKNFKCLSDHNLCLVWLHFCQKWFRFSTLKTRQHSCFQFFMMPPRFWVPHFQSKYTIYQFWYYQNVQVIKAFYVITSQKNEKW